jgi:zinc/manganese transport system permease protein
VHHVLSSLVEPGFFGSSSVHTAVLVGTVVAVVSAVVGVFTVLRGQSFAGHALGDIGTTGGSGAFLIGVNQLWGFMVVGAAAVAVMEMVGLRRPRGRDLSTGIVFGAALGLAALFLYWDTTSQSTSGATLTILFGSLFVVSGATVPLIVVLSVAAVAAVAVLYRPLLLSSMSPEIASARGVPVRLVGILYLLAMSVAVSLSSFTIGAILSTALLIGPAATALRLTKRPGTAIAVACLVGIAATWLGVLLAYDSFYWPPVDHGWPVSFFVVALIFVFYLLADVPAARRTRRLAAVAGTHRPTAAEAPASRGEPMAAGG